MKSRIRHLLCPKCKKLLREDEKKYREKNKERIRKQRNKHYVNVEKDKKVIKGFEFPSQEEIKKIMNIKKSIDKMPDEEIY